MKKITVLMLVLALAVPAQAWHLFPIRKEVVTVEKTKISYAACAITGVVVGVIGLVIGICGFRSFEYLKAWRIEEKMRMNVNKALERFGLYFYNNCIWGLKQEIGQTMMTGSEAIIPINNVSAIYQAVQRTIA
jgi:hypothetical protein